MGHDSAGTIILATNNVGKAKMKGFEQEGQYLITAATLPMADVEFLDAAYDYYAYNVPNFGAPPVTGCPYSVVAMNAARAAAGGGLFGFIHSIAFVTAYSVHEIIKFAAATSQLHMLCE